MASGTKGFQRQSDGKCCIPQGLGERWACLATTLSATGLVELAAGDAWNLPPGGNRRRGVSGWCAGTAPV